jgi:hypothetical protein
MTSNDFKFAEIVNSGVVKGGDKRLENLNITYTEGKQEPKHIIRWEGTNPCQK